MKDQEPAKDFTLYDANGIKITLNLPEVVQINQYRPELFTSAPVLHNNSAFHIASASFVINFDNVQDYSGNFIAYVRWWDNSIYDGQQRMTFTCGVVEPSETGTCSPSSPGYSQVRWSTSASSARGVTPLGFSLDLVSLTIGPIPSTWPSDGPIVQIG